MVTGKNIKILILEDNPSDSILIIDQIKRDKIGFAYRHVGSKKEYLAELNNFKPDIIISDYTLPQFNGMQALNIRNEIAPSVSFILVTGSADEEVAVSCMKAGADDYLIKRNLYRLGEAIKSALQKKELVQQKEAAEKRLEENEKKYRLMVDLSPDAILIHNVDGIQFANSTALKLLGAGSFEELQNIPIMSFIHPDYRDLALNRIKKIYKTGEPTDYIEEKYVDLNNKIIDVEVIGLPVTYTGKPSIQVIARDISSRKNVESELIKAKEKAEESDRLKSAFLQNISHEIRTPLNAIIGFTALLNEPGLDDESRKSYTEIITQSSDQLLAIVIDIIEISNIQAGIFKFEKSEMNLNSFMDNVFNLFNGKISKKNIKFTFKKSLPDNDSNIMTDSIKLGQVLANLLSNALKFTSQGKIEFGYTLKDGNIMFYVSDTGIGIAENHHSMIFDHFYQVEPLAANLYEGTGLGLSISKAYVELQSGKIWLRSEPGKGSVFYFTIPYEKVTKPEENENQSVTTGMGEEINSKTLLIAEDDNNNYNLMKQLLSDLNIKIIRASNGIEAVDICRSGEKIDMILMDIKMPLMDGYEATKQILEQSPEIKIIAQTAYSDDKEKALRSGCKGFISKPFDRYHLRTLVTEYL